MGRESVKGEDVMKQKYTLKIVVSLLIIATIGICAGCAGSTAAEPSLELVKYQSYALKDASETATLDDGTEVPIAKLYVRNKGEEAICWITIGQSWLDKAGSEVAMNEWGFEYPDVVLPGQTVRIDVTVPYNMDKQVRDKIKNFAFREYSYSTVGGSDVKGAFTDAPESLPLNKTKTVEFQDSKACQNSPISDDIVLLEEKESLTVKSIKYDAKKQQVKVKLKNKSKKRIDWSNETTFVNFQCLDKDGNICGNSGLAEIKKDGLDPGKSITVKGEFYGGADGTRYITVTGVAGFIYTPFRAIPKAVEIK